MSTLFLCTTPFQLLTTLSICKQHDFPDSRLILANGIEKIPGWIPFLIECKLFSSITAFPDKLPYHKRRHFLKIKEELEPPSFLERIVGFISPSIIIRKWLINIHDIHGNTNIHPEEVDNIFISSPMGSLWKFADFIKSQNSECKLFGFDEGLGSYLSSTFSGRKLAGIHLFQPGLSKSRLRTHKIEPLNRTEMNSLWCLARKYFPSLDAPSGNLFFDQWVGMPWINNQYENSNWKKTSYIRLKTAILKNLKRSSEEMGQKLHYIPHPLQDSSATNYFRDMGLSLPSLGTGIPFELVLLCKKEHRPEGIWFSIFSSASVMPLLAFDSDNHHTSILLYRLFEHEKELSSFLQNKELLHLLNEIAEAFPDRLAAPETLVELKSVLKSRQHTRNASDPPKTRAHLG